ncbi:hypothetical protein [Kutzneria kofuensis]|uniref:hypothetical protein n=1 Tax=Kutzneria kofuensis TaxID=103725 RepID=UPI003CD09A2E
MVPLTWALRAAGHDVLVATSSDALVVADAGLPVVDALPGLDIRERSSRCGRSTRSSSRSSPPAASPTSARWGGSCRP